MTVRTPDEAKEQVRDATDIVALVGEKVRLRRSGRSWATMQRPSRAT